MGFRVGVAVGAAVGVPVREGAIGVETNDVGISVGRLERGALESSDSNVGLKDLDG